MISLQAAIILLAGSFTSAIRWKVHKDLGVMIFLLALYYSYIAECYIAGRCNPNNIMLIKGTPKRHEETKKCIIDGNCQKGAWLMTLTSLFVFWLLDSPMVTYIIISMLLFVRFIFA